MRHGKIGSFIVTTLNIKTGVTSRTNRLTITRTENLQFDNNDLGTQDSPHSWDMKPNSITYASFHQSPLASHCEGPEIGNS